MDSTKRTIVKAISWQALGIISMTILGYARIGSIAAALSLAISASLTSFFVFFLHEKLWNRIGWGQDRRAETPPTTEGDMHSFQHMESV